MGILNVTPDSFSDGGCYPTPEKAIAHAHTMIAQGADYIDIGGESTRPGAQPLPLQQELDRILPVIEQLHQQTPTPHLRKIPTSPRSCAPAAVAAGATMINDIKALQAPAALQTCAELAVPICLMHMQGEPATMQQSPQYPDGVVQALQAFFSQRIQAATAHGIPPHRLC